MLAALRPRLRHAAILAVAALAATPAPGQEESLSTPELILAVIGADLAAGEADAAICLVCHAIGGAGPAIGPDLYEIVGAPVGRQEGFAYSPAMAALNAAGAVWTLGRLDTFLANPASAIPGTRMGFVGVAEAGDRANLLAYLRSLSENPIPLAPGGGDGARFAPLTIGAAQVENGERWYRRAGCVNCHGRTLHGVVDTREDGDGDGPALTGQLFGGRWFAGAVGALYAEMAETMPPDRPGELEPEVYVDLLAFILATNGFRTGAVDLPGDADVLAETGFYQ